MAQSEIRVGERAVDSLPADDAGLIFIGRIDTPWTARSMTPRQGSEDGPECRITLFEPWISALDGIEGFSRLEVLYWLHLSRRDLVHQCPANDGNPRGTFSLRSPVRPNPIGTSVVTLLERDGAMLRVRGLDCVSGTPLVDLKPDRLLFKPVAPPKPNERSMA